MSETKHLQEDKYHKDVIQIAEKIAKDVHRRVMSYQELHNMIYKETTALDLYKTHEKCEIYGLVLNILSRSQEDPLGSRFNEVTHSVFVATTPIVNNAVLQILATENAMYKEMSDLIDKKASELGTMERDAVWYNCIRQANFAIKQSLEDFFIHQHTSRGTTAKKG